MKQAESARSSDPAIFTQLLTQLNANATLATPQQKEHLAYLNAYSQAFEGHFEESVRQAKQLIARSSDVDTKFRAGALIVNSYAGNGQFNEGLHQLEQTLSLINRVRDTALRQHGFLAAATLYNQIGQYQLGRRYAEMVIPAPTSGRMLCFASYLKFDALLHMNALPEDDSGMVQAIDQCADEHEIVMANMIRAGLTRKWIAHGKNANALELLREHLIEAEATRYPRVVAEVESQLGQLLFARNDLAGAKAHATAAVSQSAGIINTPPVIDAYKTLYDIADRRGDPVAALAFYKKYAEANKAYLTEVKARELAYQLVKLEAQQSSQQIELLNRQNRVLQLQQAIDKASAQNSRLLMLLATVLALVLGLWAYKTRRLHASLRRMAETDALTGVCNRHHFTRRAEQSLAQGGKTNEHSALIMFDLDHFKSVNDSYGHVTGDWVLKCVANTCAELCRGIDHLGRLGGEEFAILLRGCDLKAATRVAEDCRVRISRIDSSESGYTFPITASFGVSSTAMSGYDLDKLLSHADQMLYRAKREGRNRVRAYVRDAPIEIAEQPVLSRDETAHAHSQHASDAVRFSTLSA